ncbi:MAG: phosphoribosylglycinamide formyltransferase [Erysipelotrichaceae bacterium]|nr:phosphoribosylglycinamide formyltransferase [Erysipelotrichaceae bacterium]
MKRIAIFASGSGTNFEALVQACKSKYVNAEVVLMVCDKKNAYVCERAKNHNIDSFIFSAKNYESKAAYEAEIVKKLDEYKVDLVCLAGYMKLCGEVLLNSYEGKIINIHPALLPSFKGAHGIEDAFNYGVKVFGVTVHYVDSGMDSGKIIDQEAFHIEAGDTILDVERKIHAIEHVLYPKVLKSLVEGE